MPSGDTQNSYRQDDAVPDFPDDGPVCVMDAQCALCARGAMWISRHDHAEKFRIVPLQSNLGKSLIQHYGMAPDDPTSWLLIDDGYGYVSTDAILRVAGHLGGLWRIYSIFWIVPRPLRDWAYGLVARNRYRWFGTGDMCALPSPALQRRLLR